MDKVSLSDKFARFSEHWRPKVVAALNGQEVKLVKVKGEFPWHHHEAADEMFLVWRGRFRVEFRDHIVDMGPGEFVVVPRGVRHNPVAAEECWVMLIETVTTKHTGDVMSERTRSIEEQIGEAAG